ncbi:MAG: acylneuraminate cytidylyltransferase family protein, partial [Pseudomonadota bacterium]
MLHDCNIQIVLLARGGSKGLPRKNLLPLAGEPLINWAIQAALASDYADDVIVSTDDEEIAAVAKEAGARVPFRRPDALASDFATSIEALQHAITSQKRRFDVTLLMQPTSPLVSPIDVDAAIRAVVEDNAKAAITVCAVDKPPQW